MRARIWIADKSANFATEMTQGKLMTGMQQVTSVDQYWSKVSGVIFEISR